MEESKIQFVIDENGYKHYLEEVLGGGGQGVGKQRILTF